MPLALQVDWEAIKTAYIQGVSAKDVGAQYGLSADTIYQRAKRKGWYKEKRNIEQCNEKAMTVISQKVTEKVAQKSADAIAEHLKSVLLSSNSFLSKLSDNLSSAILPDVRNHQTAMMSLKMFAETDDLIRRAHGLADPTSRVDITTNGQSIHDKSLLVLQSCQQLVKTGQASAVDIDVDGLVQELEIAQSGTGDAVATASPVPDTGTPSPTDTLSI